MIAENDDGDEAVQTLSSLGADLPRCNLFVRNKTDEFIATLEGCIGPAWWPDALVVTDYTRDPAIMRYANSASAGGSGGSGDGIVSASMRCVVAGKNAKNLGGFLKYLRDRQKAGTATHGAAQYFFLPTPNSADLGLVLLRRPLPVARQQQLQAAPPNAAAAAAAVVAGGQPQPHINQPSVRLHSAPKGSQTAPASTPAPAGSTAAPPARALSATAARNEIEALRTSTAAKLQAFVADAEALQLAFPPLGERGNYVVIEEVAEIPGLVSTYT
jgi:hypothetical protein